MTKHTPAPWTYHISDNCQSEFEIHGDCCQIGTVERWDGDDDEEVMAEAEANAQLIAAAPELFDALRELVARDRAEAAASGFEDTEMTWLEDARRAIAKATGVDQ